MSTGVSSVRRDAFLGGRVEITQPSTGYRAGLDAVLLAAAVPARAGGRVLELGCGVGTALACLSARVPGLDLTGVEITPALADLARTNLPQARIVTGDLAALTALRSESFDEVLMNPPYHGAEGPPAPDPVRDRANREGTPLASWFDTALRRLRPGGGLTVILPAWRMGEMLAGLEGRAGDVTLRPLAPRPGRAATRLIAHARKGRRGALMLLAPLTLHEGAGHSTDAGAFSPALTAILRDGAALPMSRSLDNP